MRRVLLMLGPEGSLVLVEGKWNRNGKGAILVSCPPDIYRRRVPFPRGIAGRRLWRGGFPARWGRGSAAVSPGAVLAAVVRVRKFV